MHSLANLLAHTRHHGFATYILDIYIISDL